MNEWLGRPLRSVPSDCSSALGRDMRLFDKALTQSPKLVREFIEPMLTQCVVLNADRIAEDVHQHERIQHSNYPYCIPPWDGCFVEWNAPHIETPWQHGAIVGLAKSEEVEIWSRENPTADCKAERGFIFYPLMWTGTLGLKCRCDSIAVLTDRSGLVVWTGYQDADIERDGSAQPATFALGAYVLGVIGMAFTFCNCKNVKLREVTKRDEPSAKIKRRLHIPDVKRYTLYIDGINNNPLEGSGDQEHVDRRWHICRGHFAEYTAERPLFGKLIGKYWIPQHARGNRKVGVIEKDYAIKGEVQCETVTSDGCSESSCCAQKD